MPNHNVLIIRSYERSAKLLWRFGTNICHTEVQLVRNHADLDAEKVQSVFHFAPTTVILLNLSLHFLIIVIQSIIELRCRFAASKGPLPDNTIIVEH
jgi:hypothetical protein